MSLTALGLTEAHEKLYLQALGASGTAPATSVAALHPDGPRLLDDLRGLGLIGGDDGCRVQPPSVLADLAERVADELAARQRAVARTHADIAELARTVAHRDGLGDAPGLEFVADGAAVRERIDELSFFARHSIASVQPVPARAVPDPAAPLRAPGPSREDERALRRGLDVRVLVDRPVSPVPGTRIRVVAAQDTALHRVIVIDDEVAVVSAGAGGAVIVRQPGLLALVRAYVDLLWSSAGAAAPRPQPSDGDRELLQLLQAGATDDSLARVLGVSSRQARRRVARLMTALDVSSRFAAGAEAARRGWI